ncbi:hypothetical protein ONZ43_g3145 [Nemania bipapillata]|uniref:Uncharacterized protein n=1 Tax=Nemania bipapillata TaxID=110536 RepID=A0ACC2IY09_9PEZI|nr:hypothetical protein ONZ43_g3145 [Nemania bipapillata]
MATTATTDGDPRQNSRLTQFIIWFLFIAAVFSACARLGIKYAMTHALAWDDKLIISSLLIYLAQCIAISVAESADITTTSVEQPSNSFLKVRSFTTEDPLAIVVGLWLVSAAAAGLLQCALPTPWDFTNSSYCINRRAWWTFVVVLNVITDISLVGLYFFIITGLRIARARKVSIIVAFSTKLLVVGIALAQLTAFRRGPTVGVTPNLRLSLVLNQAVLSSSVITTCIPYLKPFMQGLQAGINRVNNASAYEDELMHLPQPLSSSQSNETHR